jgi:hypothetical protein
VKRNHQRRKDGDRGLHGSFSDVAGRLGSTRNELASEEEDGGSNTARVEEDVTQVDRLCVSESLGASAERATEGGECEQAQRLLFVGGQHSNWGMVVVGGAIFQ